MSALPHGLDYDGAILRALNAGFLHLAGALDAMRRADPFSAPQNLGTALGVAGSRKASGECGAENTLAHGDGLTPAQRARRENWHRSRRSLHSRSPFSSATAAPSGKDGENENE